MTPSSPTASITSLAAQRRRALPLPEAEFLHRILVAHQDIVAAGLDPQKVVDTVTRRAQELTHSDGAVVEVVDGDELLYWSASGTLDAYRGVRVAMDRSLSGLCVKMGAVLQCDDSETDPRVDRETCRRVGLRSMLVAPLPFSGTIIGVLKVVSPWVNAYGDDDMRTLEALRTLIAAAISNAAQHALAETTSSPSPAAEDLRRSTARQRVIELLDAKSFGMALQPIFALRTMEIVGYEALARFADGRNPEAWFRDAHDAGVTMDIEIALARKALEALDRLGSTQYLSINLSPETAALPDIEMLFLEHDCTRLVIEITEHSFVEDYVGLAERMDRLKRHGVRIAIDDAGAGFASLRHVLRMRPDFIKLDRSITQDIDKELSHQALASALLTFATGTAAAIVAEGVETSAEATTLHDLGVEFGQGYYLGHPA